MLIREDIARELAKAETSKVLHMALELYGITKEQYTAYLDECKEKCWETTRG